MIDDATLTAYLDGTLSHQARAKVDAALAADPLLAARLNRRRLTRTRRAAVYDPLAEVAEPRARLAASGGRDNVVRLAAHRRAASGAPASGRIRTILLGGAALAGAAGLALMWSQGGQGAFELRPDGALVVRGGDARVLEHRPAGEPGRFRVGQTFRSSDGRYCRTFTDDRLPAAGVACREGGGWILRMLLRQGVAAGMPSAVTAAMEGMIMGSPLDREAEAEILARHWRLGA